jgi:hypothetical protein
MSITKLVSCAPVIRETQTTQDHEPIIVALHPNHMTMRLRGQRESEEIKLNYDAVYRLGKMYDKYYYRRRPKIVKAAS